MKKILITGTSGMLGKDIYAIFSNSDKFQVFGIDKIKSSQIPIESQFIGDLTNPNFLLNILNKVNPDIIIHCAAIVNLQLCETNKFLANSVHVEATELMALFNPSETKFLYISTDSVFDGITGNYLETDQTNPVNYYAESKLLGEEATQKNPNHLIIRTNIFGYSIPLRKSLAEWAINSFNQKKRISGFTDITFNAIYTKYLATILLKLVEENTTGIVNVASKNSISKYSFLKYLVAIYTGEVELVEGVISDKINPNIKRPKNTSLNISKLLKITDAPTIEEGLDELVKDYLRNRII